ncbi:E3 ubiquitin-protein ligase rad18 [Rhizina undulata]
MDPSINYAISVTDPTDWNPTRLPILFDLDSALRCQICKDFYTSPVITNCSHTFCSLCIRRALHAEQICPICRTAEQEYRLRKNNAVQELVDAFMQARVKLMEVATEKKDHENTTQIRPIEEASSSKPQSPRRSSRRGTRSQSKAAVPGLEVNDHHSEFKPADDGFVECPLCSRRMKEITINAHIDKCLLDEAGSSSSSHETQLSPTRTLRSGNSRSNVQFGKSITPDELKSLPKINYSFLKESQLRSKLVELGIPSTGGKKLLQERHSEWMNIWNANVDSNKPRTKAELLLELNTWERAHIKPPNKPTKAPGWSDDQWAIRHNDDFSLLIEQAKKRREPQQRMEESATSENKQDKANNPSSGTSSTPNAQSEQLRLSPTHTVSPSDGSGSTAVPIRKPDILPVDKGIPVRQPIPSAPPLSSGVEEMAVKQSVDAALRTGDGKESGKRKFDEMDNVPSMGATVGHVV